MALVEHMAVCGNKCHLSYLLEPSDVSRAGPPNNRIRLVLRHMGTATNLNPTKYGQTSWPQNAHSRPTKVFLGIPEETPRGQKGRRGKAWRRGGRCIPAESFLALASGGGGGGRNPWHSCSHTRRRRDGARGREREASGMSGKRISGKDEMGPFSPPRRNAFVGRMRGLSGRAE